NEYESVSKCQKSTISKVWDEKINLECENKDELKAQCNHYKNITQYTITTQPSLGGDSSIKTYKFDADECRQVNISRQKTTRDVLMYYAKERDHVKVVTAHWVDKDWKRQKRIIKFRALSPLYDVKAGLELVDDVVGKIRNRIKCIKKSRIRRKKIYDVTDESFHLNVTKNFHQDVCVRWNSTYLMFESALYYKDVLDYWGQRDKDYLIFTLSYEEWRNVAILCKIFKVFYDVTCVFSDFAQTIINNLKLLFDEHVKNSKSTSSSLAGSSNILDNNPIDSSLNQFNVNRVDLEGDYDESDNYK
ncbi:hypothetical protein Gotur_018041, partial [Gossypium turneri]